MTFHLTPSEIRHSLLVQQICITLRFLATGTFYLVLGDLNFISKSSVCRVVHRVCNAIARRADRFIQFPRGEDARRVKRGFYDIAGKEKKNNK